MKEDEPILIVDGDIVNFTICRTTEDITDFGDEVMESFDEEATLRQFELALDSIAKKTGYDRDHIIFAITSETSFRKIAFPTYKQNRKKVKKPLGLKFLREYQLKNAEKYQTLMMEGLEADDCMGIYASAVPHISIYSQDKDLKTIPCRQWDFKKDKFIVQSVLEANRFLYTQVLTGDAVDGIKGCPRIGKIKAARALANCSNELEMLKVCYLLYFDKFKDKAKDKLLYEMGMLRILHNTDYMILENFGTTYNPFEVLNVTEETLNEWVQEHKESNDKAGKKVRKKGSRHSKSKTETAEGQKERENV